MSRMLRIGLLLLVAMWVSDSTALAQAPKYGLVYQIYNDGDNVLYLCDVNVRNCEEFSPAYAWDVENPEKPVPWVNCEADFYLKACAVENKDGERPELTKGLKNQLPSDADAAFLESGLPPDREWPGEGRENSPRWNPREAANIVLVGRKVLNIGNQQTPVLKEVALFSVEPSVERSLRLDRVKETRMPGRDPVVTPINVPWKNVRRFFALEVASDGTTPDPTEAIPATSLQRDGEFLHQWTFRYRGITVPAILRE